MSLGSPNAKLFINYRREDTAPYAGRLYDRLIAHFGEDQVFIDIDQIEPGEDFVEAINSRVGACDIAIVAIGPNWLTVVDASGKRRLDDSEDFVRMEIVAALKRKIRLIPVLVGGARMPRKQDLPGALAPLSRRNAIELSETRFHSDVSRLIQAIEKPRTLAEKKWEPPPLPAASIADPAPPVELPRPEKLQETSARHPLAEPPPLPAASTADLAPLVELPHPEKLQKASALLPLVEPPPGPVAPTAQPPPPGKGPHPENLRKISTPRLSAERVASLRALLKKRKKTRVAVFVILLVIGALIVFASALSAWR